MAQWEWLTSIGLEAPPHLQPYIPTLSRPRPPPPNTLIEQLKVPFLVSHISTSASTSLLSDTSALYIDLSLTPQGKAHVVEVIFTVYSYIHYLYSLPDDYWIALAKARRKKLRSKLKKIEVNNINRNNAEPGRDQGYEPADLWYAIYLIYIYYHIYDEHLLYRIVCYICSCLGSSIKD